VPIRLSKTDARHEPFSLHNGSHTLVVLVHGLCGSPAQMRPIAEDLADGGMDVDVLLLPGHGGGSGAFFAARASDWQDHVDTAVRAGLGRYSAVFLMGHSLGALLCLDAAARLPVRGVICLGAPMGVRTSRFQLHMGLRVALGRSGGDDEAVRFYRAASGISVRCPLEYLLWLPPFARLLVAIARARRSMATCTCPVLVIQSDRDETVSRHSARRIASAVGGPVRVVRLSRSLHAYIDPGERPALRELVLSFCRTGDPGEAVTRQDR
jgi:carboxylesterase